MLNHEIKVSQVMMSIEEFPCVEEQSLLKEVLEEMTQKSIGIVCIINAERKLLGVLTDGDLRRMILRIQKPFSAFFVDDALDHAAKSALVVKSSDSLEDAVKLMGIKRVWDLPVVDDDAKLVGLLHLHSAIDLLLKKYIQN
ncbi:CBS domain-containing protein [Candidatus Methylopumilus planktonicus]|uniref:CBS domain-containing protein n=1 Tax=Candidatus Methylopumilus planktonicus TaxID=1581557 RepID=UPI003BEF2238